MQSIVHSWRDCLEGHVQIGNKPKGLRGLYSWWKNTYTISEEQGTIKSGGQFIHLFSLLFVLWKTVENPLVFVQLRGISSEKEDQWIFFFSLLFF